MSGMGWRHLLRQLLTSHSDPEVRARPAPLMFQSHLAGLALARLPGLIGSAQPITVSGVVTVMARPKYASAERTCESCKQPYRGNSRAKVQRCPACRSTCADCGKPKNPKDSHTQCGICRAAGKICVTCGVNPTFQNRRECWDCISAGGIYAAQARDRIYNLPPGWYDQKLAEQGSVCEISGQPETSVSKRTGKAYPLAVDHDRSCCPGDRSCGECLRGLIRRNLNVALGMFGDDPELLRAAADYIEKYRRREL